MKDLNKIIHGCRQNDRKSQEKVFNSYKSLFLAVATRYTGNREIAKDVVQETFIKIFKKIRSLKVDHKFEAWSRRILVNTAISHLRKEKHFFEEYDEAHVTDYNLNLNGEMNLIRKMDTQYLLKLVSELPDGYRTVFNLYLIEGYSHAEIAEMLNISESTSRTQLFKAKKYFQNVIKNLNIKNYG